MSSCNFVLIKFCLIFVSAAFKVSICLSLTAGSWTYWPFTSGQSPWLHKHHITIDINSYWSFPQYDPQVPRHCIDYILLYLRYRLHFMDCKGTLVSFAGGYWTQYVYNYKYKYKFKYKYYYKYKSNLLPIFTSIRLILILIIYKCKCINISSVSFRLSAWA